MVHLIDTLLQRALLQALFCVSQRCVQTMVRAQHTFAGTHAEHQGQSK